MWCSLVLYPYIICLACLITHLPLNAPLNAWPNNAPSVFYIFVGTTGSELYLLFDCMNSNVSLTEFSSPPWSGLKWYSWNLVHTEKINPADIDDSLTYSRSSNSSVVFIPRSSLNIQRIVMLAISLSNNLERYILATDSNAILQ